LDNETYMESCSTSTSPHKYLCLVLCLQFLSPKIRTWDISGTEVPNSFSAIPLQSYESLRRSLYLALLIKSKMFRGHIWGKILTLRATLQHSGALMVVTLLPEEKMD